MPFKNIIRHWHWFVLTAVFWIIIIRNIPTEFVDLGGDSAQYIILAESISQGKGFRMINYPGEPFCFYYPPVFPLLLSPLVYFLKRNFFLMHVLVAFLGYLSLFFIYQIFKRYGEKKYYFFPFALLALNSVFLSYCANYILSDIPYLFFSAFTLFWAVRYLDNPSFLNKQGLLVIFGLALSYFSRYAGLTLLPGIIASLLLSAKADKKVNFKKIIFLAGTSLAIFAFWQIFKSFKNTASLASHINQLFLVDPYAPHKGGLFTHPLYFVIRFIDGVNYYFGMLSAAFLPPLLRTRHFLRDFLSCAILIIMLAGLWLKFKECKNGIFHCYFLFYFLLIIFWPFREGPRFILPLLPFIFFYFFGGLKKILSFLPERIGYFCFLIIFSAFFILNLSALPTKAYSFEALPGRLKNFVSLHDWIKENLPQEGIIISRKPALTFFYTNHKSISYPFSANPDGIWEEILKKNAKYIILDEFSKESFYYLLPFIIKYEGRLTFINRIGKTGLFEIKK